jgi:hypothetical protein
VIGVALLGAMAHAQAGQTPGIAGPWNGPWGGGALNGEPYTPLSNPYVGAGYTVGGPPPYGAPGPGGGYPMPQQPQQPQPRYLPGGGYLLPPAAGGGMLPGSYANH